MSEVSTKIIEELSFKTSRSGGSGGQHVNKVSSKVMLIWDIRKSKYFNDYQKTLIERQLANRINKDGYLFLESAHSRSQFENKDIVINRFLELIADALRVNKPRIATKIPKSKIIARMDRKKIQSKKKADRRWRYE